MGRSRLGAGMISDPARNRPEVAGERARPVIKERVASASGQHIARRAVAQRAMAIVGNVVKWLGSGGAV
jgi:hypothetical protein